MTESTGQAALDEPAAEGAPRESFPLALEEQGEGHVERLLVATHAKDEDTPRDLPAPAPLAEPIDGEGEE